MAHRQDAKSADIPCGLAITEGRDEPELKPADENAADLVLVRHRGSSPPRGRRIPRLTHHYPIGAVLGLARDLRIPLLIGDASRRRRCWPPRCQPAGRCSRSRPTMPPTLRRR